MATISEVAKHLGVDRDTVKSWTTKFAEHLSMTANPRKGKERQFGEADLRVLALVADFWEDDPDLEYIRAMLNSGEYNEERYLEIGRLHTPLFQEVPDEIEETWRHGAVVGGMASRRWPEVARAYKTAADELVKLALTQYEPHELDYPIVFLYRHTIEVYLKAMLTTRPETHDLGRLVALLEEQCGKNIAPWIKDRVRDFQQIDQQSDAFRYAEPGPGGELWINFHQLQVVMDRLVKAFEEQITGLRYRSVS